MAIKKYIIDNPTLMLEWDWNENNCLNIDPYTITSTSKIKANWKCAKGHKYQSRIEHKYNGIGCPFCSGRYPIKGENDLQTVSPLLSQEWNYEKNNGLTPRDVLPNSGKKVWWICKKGHEWQTRIADRNAGKGCPTCKCERHTSFPEYALVYYLEKCKADFIHSYKEMGYELDIYIPSKKTAIEYDGNYCHKNKTKQDLQKNLNCQKDGITLYRIRDELPALQEKVVAYIKNNINEF